MLLGLLCSCTRFGSTPSNIVDASPADEASVTEGPLDGGAKNRAEGGTVTMGVVAVLADDDTGFGNRVNAQEATLVVDAMLESLSLYVRSPAGSLRLGIYDNTGPSGGPGLKVAEAPELAAVAGWNTATLTTPAHLQAGTYWLAYTCSSGTLIIPVETSGRNAVMSRPYSLMPATFDGSILDSPQRWSLYATLSR
jgi:hypothetical protein